MEHSAELTGAILVGGRSSRMGRNKALLTLDSDGATLVETIAGKIRPLVNDLMLVGSVSEDYSFLGLPQIEDLTPGLGPLGGIYTALREAPSSHVLVVACDMPFLSVDLLRYMVSEPRDYDVLVPHVERLQPLHAIYAQTCIPLIEQAMSSGSTGITKWFSQANVQVIDQSTITRYDPALLSPFNMNTPGHLESARKICAVNKGSI